MRADWELKPLGDVCEFKNGFAFKSSKFTTDGIPVVRIGDIRDGGVMLDKAVFACQSNHGEDLEKYEVLPGDLLIAMSGATTGKVGLNKTGKTLYQNQRVGRFIPKKDLEKRYLFYFLLMKTSQNLSISKGSAQPNLSTTQIQETSIPLPPLEEQRRIVAILDEALEGLETAQANAEANLASAEELLGSGVGEYLKNKVQTQRTTTTLKAICSKIGSGATPKGGEKSYKETGVPLIRSLNVYDREFRYDKIAYLDEDQAASLVNVTLKQGDVLLNITGASVARCCVLPNDLIGGRVNQHVSIIRIKENILHPELLSYILTSNETKHDLLAVGNAGGTTRQAITKSQIEEFKISFPTDYQEQSKLVTRLQQIEECVLSSQRNLRDKSIEVSELRQSLLQKAFAGELT